MRVQKTRCHRIAYSVFNGHSISRQQDPRASSPSNYIEYFRAGALTVPANQQETRSSVINAEIFSHRGGCPFCKRNPSSVPHLRWLEQAKNNRRKSTASGKTSGSMADSTNALIVATHAKTANEKTVQFPAEKNRSLSTGLKAFLSTRPTNDSRGTAGSHADPGSPNEFDSWEKEMTHCFGLVHGRRY